MRNGFARVGLIFGVVAFAAVSAASADDTTPHIALKAVKVNDIALPGAVSDVDIQPGDVVEAEVYISNWAKLPGGARTYQWRFTGQASAVSGGNGTVLPLGWLAKLKPTPCGSNPGVCDPDEVCVSGICVYPGHNPQMGAFINTGRPNFMFYGMTIIQDVNRARLNYIYFAQASNDTAIDDGTPAYAGTIKLVASDYACGTFAWGFEETNFTYVGDNNNQEHFPTVEPLRLHLDVCPPIPLEFTPANCAVDAGLPHDVYDAGMEYGVDTFKIVFDVPAAGINCSDFLISKVPPFGGDPAPSCNSVSTSGNTALLNLSGFIPLHKWTCFLHYDSNIRACVGYLPGDANADASTVAAEDVSDLVLNLKQDYDPPMHLEQCDVDRSNACAPQDILSAIDLLNGAEAFDSWEGAIIGTTSAVSCPTER